MGASRCHAGANTTFLAFSHPSSLPRSQEMAYFNTKPTRLRLPGNILQLDHNTKLKIIRTQCAFISHNPSRPYAILLDLYVQSFPI